MTKTIANREVKGNITVITFEDGTFWVITGEIQEFETAVMDDVPEKLKAPKEEVEDEKPKDEKPKEDKEEPEDDDYWTKEDIDDLTKKELIELISDEELDIEPDDIASIKKLRREVMKELGV